MPFSARDFTFEELAAQRRADSEGETYLLFRDDGAAQRVLSLAGRREFNVGRLAANDLAIVWDGEVSRSHALLERRGEEWTVVDDGLSRNGTFVNGERVRRRRRLRDRDVLRFGRTEVWFRDPVEHGVETAPPSEPAQIVHLSEAQRRVLVELCRPLAEQRVAAPASNREIAAALHVSVEAVRTHLKTLFQRFEVPDLPQNRKRAELALRALASGVVNPRDLEPSG